MARRCMPRSSPRIPLLLASLVGWQLLFQPLPLSGVFHLQDVYAPSPSLLLLSSAMTKPIWSPQTYLRLALTGPRKCHGALPCYIVDVVPDPYQPRIFLSMLGLPASDIARQQRGQTSNVSFVDIRTGEWMTMGQSRSLVNETHGFALLLTTKNNQGRAQEKHMLLVSCNILKHQNALSLGAFYESMTYACDLPSQGLFGSDGEEGGFLLEEVMRVDVLLAPKHDHGRIMGRGGRKISTVMEACQNLNGPDRPFYISSKPGYHSSGLFNSVSRQHVDGSSDDTYYSKSLFSWWQGTSGQQHHESLVEEGAERRRNATTDVSNSATSNEKRKKNQMRMSACLIGVNYFSLQHREIIQYYVTSGFDHIYLGLPQWPTSDLFNQTWNYLGNFVHEGKLSIIVSEYAANYIQPEIFGQNFTYAPQGHKSSFVNTCILVSRAAGDDLVFVGDMDELLEHSEGNQTTVAEAVAKQLSIRNTTLQDTCAVNMGSVDGLYHMDKAGYSVPGRIIDKLAGIGHGSTNSVNVYGKSISNAHRILRAGLHGPAYCEALPGAEVVPDGELLTIHSTRPSVITKKNTFRADQKMLRILHLGDSYRLRSSQSELEVAKGMVEWGAMYGLISYYARDWSDLVNNASWF